LKDIDHNNQVSLIILNSAIMLILSSQSMLILNQLLKTQNLMLILQILRN